MRTMHRSLSTALMTLVLSLAMSLVMGQPALAQAPVAPPDQNPFTINVSQTDALGSFLVDGNGMTLYYNQNDTPGTPTSDPVSSCTGDCLTNWPAFNPSTISVPDSLNAADFVAFTRPDGTIQLAYKGWPLYYFVQDQAAGDINGQGLAGMWAVMPVGGPQSPTIGISQTADLGSFLVDGNGMTLYYNLNDTQGTASSDPVSSCTGNCLANWPAFNPSTITVPSGLNAGDFTVFTRPDGTMQVAYKGWPLYYFVKDQAAGDVNGQGVASMWAVMPVGGPQQ